MILGAERGERIFGILWMDIDSLLVLAMKMLQEFLSPIVSQSQI
jgi:hypothetical protein